MSIRLRRLQAEYEQLISLFADHERIRIAAAIGHPPDKYIIEYRVLGLVEEKGEIKNREVHRAQITLGNNYPRERPRCVMLTPVFHPNIDYLAICTEDIGAAGQTLDQTIVFIGEMITYQAYNLQSPRNGDAARWTMEHRDRVPLEVIDLMPRALTQGGLDTGLAKVTAPSARTGPGIVPAAAPESCANCGQLVSAAELLFCGSRHLVCSDCRLLCKNCGQTLCVLCTVRRCVRCQEAFCPDCMMVCDGCDQPVCLMHVQACKICNQWRCLLVCLRHCEICGGANCLEHLNADHHCTKCSDAGRDGTAPLKSPEWRSTAGTSANAESSEPARATSLALERAEPHLVITKQDIREVPPTALGGPIREIQVGPPKPRRVSRKAIASLVFGIAGIPIIGLLVGWIAILLGSLALREMKRADQWAGQGIAISGIVVGAFDIVLWIVLFRLLL